jgi:regulator of sirC expression with transglutaminase-like and TPR domain
VTRGKRVRLSEALASGLAIDELALIVAQDVRADASVDAARAFFDRAASKLEESGAALLKPRTQAAMLSEHVFLEHQFRGNETDYYDPRNSDLTSVVERRLGIPLTLGIVMVAIGRRAGLTVRGVGFPGHFLVRVGEGEGVLVDPFADGARSTGRGSISSRIAISARPSAFSRSTSPRSTSDRCSCAC